MSVCVLYIILLGMSRRADGVEINFFPTLMVEAASSRWWRPYFDFGLFVLLLKVTAVSTGWRKRERKTVQTDQHTTSGITEN